jgi:hypothetical protein
MPLSQSGVPSTGHTWMAPLEKFVQFLLSDATGGLNFLAVDFLQQLPLPANTYANGTSGVGATLTGNANGALVLADGSTPSAGQLVIVNGEAAPANNGLYIVTNPGSSSAAYVLTRFAGITGPNAVPAWDASAKWVAGTIFGVRSGAFAGKTLTYPGPSAPTVGTTAVGFALAPKPALFRGVIAGSRIAFSVNPSNNDTITLGGVQFKFVSALGAAGAAVQVLIGGTAALTLTNVVNAINGDASSKGTTWAEATTPFAGAVRAYKPTATSLGVRNAAVRGGAPVVGPGPSFALLSSITGGASAWQYPNLNVPGKLDTDAQEASGAVTVTAAMITFATLDIDLPFVPSIFQCQVFSSAGVQRAYSDVTTILNNGDGTASIHIALGGGATPNIQANDVLTFWAQQ